MSQLLFWKTTSIRGLTVEKGPQLIRVWLIVDNQPKYLITRNMKTQVSNMPPIMMNLSCVARRSISRITVLDSPNMFATSSIFLWVPWETETWVTAGRTTVYIIVIRNNSADSWSRKAPTPSGTRRRSVRGFSWRERGAKTHPDKTRPKQEEQKQTHPPRLQRGRVYNFIKAMTSFL